MCKVIDLNVVRVQKEAKRLYNNRIHAINVNSTYYIHVNSVPTKTREDLLADVKAHYTNYVKNYDKDDNLIIY
jgi:hypothetical protein